MIFGRGGVMANIADAVKLKSGYANFVELKSTFEANQENADRMVMYQPAKAHRAAFERICRRPERVKPPETVNVGD